MANWVRSPSQRWFTNTRWVDYAFESAKTSDPKWNSYYGSTRYFRTSEKRVNILSGGVPTTAPQYIHTIGWCEMISQCGLNPTLLSVLCAAARSRYKREDSCPDEPCGIGRGCACEVFCPPDWECTKINEETGEVEPNLCECAEQMRVHCLNEQPGYWGNEDYPFWGGFEPQRCDSSPSGDCICGECNPNIAPCNTCVAEYTIPLSEIPTCLGRNGGFVHCDDPLSTGCDVCSGGPICDDIRPCPCGVTSDNPYDGPGVRECLFLLQGEECPSFCCLPGETSCVECCDDDNPDCGIWAPIDLCCTSCSDEGCRPFGYPMPPSFCESCEYCNIDPTASQCTNCCQCPGSDVYLTCEEVENGACDPPECADFSANCYECGGTYIPIWFGCYDEDPCPNPFNPDCTTGEETVCYDYNTNDPIYYNPSNLGASVILEYDNPTTNTPYAYGNIATLCAVPDSLQLCVYLVDGSGTKTQLAFESDFTINEQAATITILPSVTVTGFAKVRFERCSNDKRMFLTFKDGAKLSAEDLNTSIHQLLFLIQEKEFASNTYYQVANDDGSGNALFTVTPALSSPFNFNLTSVGANDVLTWDGNGSFVGSSPSQVLSNAQLDNLSNVVISNATQGQFLTFDGFNWINSTLADETIYFNNWEEYNVELDDSLGGYYNEGCDSFIGSKWNSIANNCLTEVPKNLVPNAITSFGLGYYAAEAQIAGQLALSSTGSALQTFVNNKINEALLQTSTILSSIRWEIGKGEGRNLSLIPNYPLAYFDIQHFDTLDHPSGTLNGSSAASSDLAYYRPFSEGFCSTCRNKIYTKNLEKFLFSGNKSTTFGLEFTSGTLNPTEDRYLNRLRSVINKKDWGTALGYTNEHPLKDYPSSTNQYTTATDNLISSSYIFTDTVGSNNYNNTKHVPSIVTYYLSNLWDSTQGLPSWVVWDGNMDTFGNISSSGIAPEVSSYLGGTLNNWFYWRWQITGHDSDGVGGTVTKYDTFSYYNPFDPSLLSLESDPTYSILPASETFTDYTTDSDARTMAKTGSYSIKVDANKVFSNLSLVMPDMYDEYVFEVQFAPQGRVSTTNCPDASCYEIVTKIEKFIDGCYDGLAGCTQMGSGSSNLAGPSYHIYPDEFNADVVRAWDTYPYEKLEIEIRNKTGLGFDLVLKVPRIKRIGMIDVFKDPYAPEGNFRQLALDFISDYYSLEWDSTSSSVPEDNSDADKHNKPPLYGDMHINRLNTKGGSAAAFSVETAVQFIRVGIPSNIRVSFFTLATPQTNLFTG